MKWMKLLSVVVPQSLWAGMVAAIMVLAIPASAQLQIDHIDTSRLPVIDGDLSEWEDMFGAPHLTQADFSSIGGEITGAVPEDEQKIEVWLGWNDRTDMIYVAARVTDDAFGTNTTPENPGAVWKSDDIEVYLDADNSGGVYNSGNAHAQQYVLNPQGTQGAVLFPFGMINPPKVQAEVERSENVYTYELALPGWNAIEADGVGVQHNFRRNQVIGLSLDFKDADSDEDADNSSFTADNSLNGRGRTWSDADRLADFKLVGKFTGLTTSTNKAGGYRGGRFARKPIVPGVDSWGAIKILLQGGMEE